MLITTWKLKDKRFLNVFFVAVKKLKSVVYVCIQPYWVNTLHKQLSLDLQLQRPFCLAIYAKINEIEWRYSVNIFAILP